MEIIARSMATDSGDATEGNGVRAVTASAVPIITQASDLQGVAAIPCPLF
jgi:hypothetical protein